MSKKYGDEGKDIFIKIRRSFAHGSVQQNQKSTNTLFRWKRTNQYCAI